MLYNSGEDMIIAKNVSKVFYKYKNSQQRLKQFFVKEDISEQFRALDNVSFTVRRGDTVGIIGKNGSGKSTLLQLIAGTMSLTEGEIVTKGRIVALLELGSGFNLEFTGKENVYLNGAIYGISREEMESKYEQIIQFADIGEFIDQPVKTYSSGMFARLAFSVAINMEPDILIVDEILAVGDIAFQAKCVAKLRKMKDEGLTLLFVSHSIDALKSLCNEAILLSKGKLIVTGSSEEISNIYLAMIREEMNGEHVEDVEEYVVESENKEFKYGSGDVFFKKVEILDSNNKSTVAFSYGDLLTLRCHVFSHLDVKNVNVSFLVRDITGIDLCGTTLFDEKIPLITMTKGEGKFIDFVFPVQLRSGSYSVSVAVNTVSEKDYSDVYLYEQIDAAASFEVIRDPDRPVHYKFYLDTKVKIN